METRSSNTTRDLRTLTACVVVLPSEPKFSPPDGIRIGFYGKSKSKTWRPTSGLHGSPLCFAIIAAHSTSPSMLLSREENVSKAPSGTPRNGAVTLTYGARELPSSGRALAPLRLAQKSSLLLRRSPCTNGVLAMCSHATTIHMPNGLSRSSNTFLSFSGVIMSCSSLCLNSAEQYGSATPKRTKP